MDNVYTMDLVFTLIIVVLGLIGIVATAFIIRNERNNEYNKPFDDEHPDEYDEFYGDK